jgi:hypothetical protein
MKHRRTIALLAATAGTAATMTLASTAPAQAFTNDPQVDVTGVVNCPNSTLPAQGVAIQTGTEFRTSAVDIVNHTYVLHLQEVPLGGAQGSISFRCPSGAIQRPVNITRPINGNTVFVNFP